MVQAEAEVQLRRLLDELRPDERAVIVLRYWYDLSVKEIADAMKSSEHAVRTRLYRARRRLAASGLGSTAEMARAES
jgi:RNA polymerase sigma-70 factor (ECF subfamily)